MCKIWLVLNTRKKKHEKKAGFCTDDESDPDSQTGEVSCEELSEERDDDYEDRESEEKSNAISNDGVDGCDNYLADVDTDKDSDDNDHDSCGGTTSHCIGKPVIANGDSIVWFS